jgi:Flp pilus assembly protein TadD
MQSRNGPPVGRSKWSALVAAVSLLTLFAIVRVTAQQSAQGLTQRGYVDSKLCSSCHSGVYNSYVRTAMARSFARPGIENDIEDYTNNNSFFHPASATSFEMIRRDSRYYQRRYQSGYGGVKTNIDETRIDYTIGSGSHARAYLHRTADGKLMQLPLAWYPEDGGHWGMSPGYDSADHQYGRRAIAYECFFCHNAYPEIPDRNQRLRDEPVYSGELAEGIDCQRCHGPGAEHIRAAEGEHVTAEAIRKAIVNPARLSQTAALEVCLQCHLQSTSRHLPDSVRSFSRAPFSYVPGQPLSAFRIFFERAPGGGDGDGIEIDHSAFRLLQSQCFLKSRGALTCVSCHNPHEPLVSGPQAVAHYDSVCRGCHASAVEKLVTAGNHPAAADCTGCHMPRRRTTDVVHVVMTDHLIQRRKPAGDLLAAMPEREESSANRYRGEVVPFYPVPAANELIVSIAQVQDGSNLTDGLRRLTTALKTSKPAMPEPWVEYGEALRRDGQIAQSIAAYKEAIARDPSYVAAFVGLGSALQESGRRPEAAKAFNQATQAGPADPRGWSALGTVELESGHVAQARAAFERAAEIDPEMPEPHNGLGIAMTQQGMPAKAESQFREAIRLLPNYSRAHANLGQLLMSGGDSAQAEWEFGAAARLSPNDAAVRFNHSRALNKLARFDEARLEAEASIRRNPGVEEAHELLGRLMERDSQFDDARREYETAIRLRPGPSQAELDLGILLVKNGDRAGAERHLKLAEASTDSAIRDLARQAIQQLNHAPN